MELQSVTLHGKQIKFLLKLECFLIDN